MIPDIAMFWVISTALVLRSYHRGAGTNKKSVNTDFIL
jgi:hypothetical protein